MKLNYMCSVLNGLFAVIFMEKLKVEITDTFTMLAFECHGGIQESVNKHKLFAF